MHQTDIENPQERSAPGPISETKMVKILRGHFADERLYALDLTPTILFILEKWIRSAKAESELSHKEAGKGRALGITDFVNGHS